VGIGAAEDVAVADLKGLDESQAVFAIIDGLDSGTLFEIGYARAQNIPVIVFVQSEGTEALKMLVGTGCEIIHDFATCIYRVKWVCMQP
jgi:nucleoside 2-deoxyribosyltransferase